MELKKVVAVVAAFAVAGVTSISGACSVCLTGAEDATAEAINASVLFLMATPYLVVGSIVGGLFLAYRRAAAKSELVEEGQAAVPTSQNDKESGR
jgi:hypothetical protein